MVKKVLSVRVSDETLAAIDVHRAGMSRTKWVEQLIEDALEDDREDAEVQRAVDTDFAEARRTKVCDHPRARVIKGFCYKCGSMVLPK